MGASGEAQQTALKAVFKDVTTRAIMTPAEELQTVSEDTTVANLLERMLRERHVGYPVLQDGDFVGMIPFEDTRSVREVERDAYLVKEVMTRYVPTVHPNSETTDVLEIM